MKRTHYQRRQISNISRNCKRKCVWKNPNPKRIAPYLVNLYITYLPTETLQWPSAKIAQYCRTDKRNWKRDTKNPSLFWFWSSPFLYSAILLDWGYKLIRYVHISSDLNINSLNDLKSKCGNIRRILLSLRFYVNSILVKIESVKYIFYIAKGSEFWIRSIFAIFKAKIVQNAKS